MELAREIGVQALGLTRVDFRGCTGTGSFVSADIPIFGSWQRDRNWDTRPSDPAVLKNSRTEYEVSSAMRVSCLKQSRESRRFVPRLLTEALPPYRKPPRRN